MNWRIATWCAVSTKPQADKISLSRQEQLGREFAATVGGSLVSLFRVPRHPHLNWLSGDRLVL